MAQHKHTWRYHSASRPPGVTILSGKLRRCSSCKKKEVHIQNSCGANPYWCPDKKTIKLCWDFLMRRVQEEKKKPQSV